MMLPLLAIFVVAVFFVIDLLRSEWAGTTTDVERVLVFVLVALMVLSFDALRRPR